MHSVEVLLGLLAALAVLATFAARIGVPSPIVQVLGGAALGFWPGLPRIEVAPDIIFLLFLPPLIYASAFFSSLRDIRANVRPIALLAIGLVLATMVAVAAAAHAAIPGLPWPAAFVLGAVVAPPDAVAVSAIAGRLELPRRIVTILERESLVNDPTALVAYRMAVGAAVTGSFSVESAGLQLLEAAVGGVVIGLAVGWLAVFLRGRAEDPPVHMTVSLLTPFAAFLSAEALGISGVVAVVTAGLYVGWMSPMVDSPNVRVQTRAVWNSLLFLLNGTLFIMLGLQGRDLLAHLSRWSPVTLLGLALLVCLTVLVVRIIWVFLFNTYLPRALSRRLRERDPYPPWQAPAIIAWAGLRGTDSMAAALAIPLATASGAPFPYRSLILFLAFCVILAALVMQGPAARQKEKGKRQNDRSVRVCLFPIAFCLAAGAGWAYPATNQPSEKR